MSIIKSKKFPRKHVEKNSLFSLNSKPSLDDCRPKHNLSSKSKFSSDVKTLLNKTHILDTHRFSASPENGFRRFKPRHSRNSFEHLCEKNSIYHNLQDGLDHTSKKTLKHISKSLTKSLIKFQNKMMHQIHENLRNHSGERAGISTHATISESSGKSNNTIGSSFSKKLKKRKSFERYDLKKKIKNMLTNLKPSPSLVIQEVFDQTLPPKSEVETVKSMDFEPSVGLSIKPSAKTSGVPSLDNTIGEDLTNPIRVSDKTKPVKLSWIPNKDKLMSRSGTASQKSQTVQTQSLRSRKSQTSFQSSPIYSLGSNRNASSMNTTRLDKKTDEITKMQEQLGCLNCYPQYYPCYYYCNCPPCCPKRKKKCSSSSSSSSSSSYSSYRSDYKYSSKYDHRYEPKYDYKFEDKYNSKYSSRSKPEYDTRYESKPRSSYPRDNGYSMVYE